MPDELVRHFSYRHPRYALRLRMDFVVGETVVLGVCESLSESGLSGLIAEGLPLGVQGQATLYHEKNSVSIPASLSFREKDCVGFTFLFDKEEERAAVRAFIAIVRPRLIS